MGCHGTTFKVKHDYFNFWEDSNGPNLQSKIFSHVHLLSSPTVTYKVV